MVKKTNTPITVKKIIVDIMKTAAMTRERTIAALETAALVGITAITKTRAIINNVVAMAKAPKVFKKEFIIVMKEKTATVVAKTFRKNSVVNFNKKEKYIKINGNIVAFVLRKKKTALAKAWRE